MITHFQQYVLFNFIFVCSDNENTSSPKHELLKIRCIKCITLLDITCLIAFFKPIHALR